MNVLMLSSVSTNIDPYYVSMARNIAKYLADNGFDLVFGGASTSMTGVCYEEFVKNNREIYLFTTEKYLSDLVNLPKAKPYIRETTFDMKKSMFENSDLIVALPGGYGTLSEILSYMEENRSNDKCVPILIHDEDKFYDKLFETLDIIKDKGFASSDVRDLVSISHNKDEFDQEINKFLIKKRRI